MIDLLANTWYMGAWTHEITDKPLSRRLLGVGTMFYRKSDGGVVAMRDRCPHRFAPLSGGKVIDDGIECPYHGLVFDSSGQCVSSPFEERPPRSLRAQTFPVVERDNIIWFWPGEPDRADPDLIADFSGLSSTRFKHVFGMTEVAANYELETDNLMDLTHSRTVHTAFGGGIGKESDYSAGRTGNQVHSNWFTANTVNPPILEYGAYPTGGALVDQWLEMRWDPPGAMYLEVATVKSGHPREEGHVLPSWHILTPMGDHKTAYFWAGAIGADDPIDIEQLRTGLRFAFEEEDRPMLENISRAMEGETDLLAMKPLLLRADTGTVLCRRTLKELIAAERAQAGELAVAAE